MREFAEHFEQGLARVTGAVRQVDSVAAAAAAGEVVDGRGPAAWCEDLETDNDVVVYRADPEPTTWTRACIRQSDLLLLVADDDDLPGAPPVSSRSRCDHARWRTAGSSWSSSIPSGPKTRAALPAGWRHDEWTAITMCAPTGAWTRTASPDWC